MKKMIAFILALTVMAGLLFGCGEEKKEEDNRNPNGMKIATTTGDFKAYADSQEDRIDLLHEAGFRYIDLSLYDKADMEPFFEDNWKTVAADLKKYASDKGMEFVQAHAIGGNAFKDEESYDTIVKNTIRGIEVCKELGIPQIVVHAPYRSHMTKDEFFEENKAFYQEFVPTMEATGVKVLIENSAQKIVGCDYYFYTGADMREFIEYFDHPLLAACWDTGHANVQGRQYEDIIDLGDLLAGIHVADNNGEEDEHLMPYQGTMSIDAVMTALVKIGYKGAFTFECENNLNAGLTWPNPREKFDQSLKAYMPPVEIKMEVEKTMYNIAVHILTKYKIEIAG